MIFRILIAIPSLLLLLCIGLTGCAGITYQAVPYVPVPLDTTTEQGAKEALEAHTKNLNADAGPKYAGIRYYGSSLYLMINSDGKGGVQWRIIELPDQTKKMSAQPYNFIAQLSSTLVFQNGILMGSAVQADSTAVPRAVLDAITKVLPAAAKLLLARPEGATEELLVRPELYKIVVRDDTVEFNGGPADFSVHVTLTPHVN
jgi:hypothetical protein